MDLGSNRLPSPPALWLFSVLVLLGLLQGGAADVVVSGRVRAVGTGEPLAGAIVSWQAQDRRVTTDAAGNFALPVPAGESLPITAAHKGYYTRLRFADAPATGLEFRLEPVPVGNHSGYALLDPQTCSQCHPDQFTQWQDTPMARAGQNTWVHDTYSGLGTPHGSGGFVYLRDSVLAAANPASECASCHQPENWLAQPFSALESLASPPTPQMLHGVSCEVCHKIADVDPAKVNFPGLFPGTVTIARPESAEHQVQYGVQADVTYEAYGLMRASYQPQLVAEACATCHQDSTDVQGDNSYTGPISEGTYLEWKESPYADPASPHFATCVDCHMPATDDEFMCSYGLPRAAGTIRSHTIEGTTPAFLENALDLALEPAVENGRLRVRVAVSNTRTDHAVPSGVTIRNVILLVEARRQEDGQALSFVAGPAVHALGGVGDPAAGYYAGLPGRLFAKVIHDARGYSPTFFTDATGVVFDNRIAPFATDHSEYKFQLPPGGGTIEVRGKLVYRRAFRDLMDAKQWTKDGHGRTLADVTAPHFGHLMEEAAATIQVAALVLKPQPASTDFLLAWPVFGERPIETANRPAGPWEQLDGPFQFDTLWRWRLVPDGAEQRYFRFAPTAANDPP
ncbi:MAG TPA: carboxypeptidase regulatory-like domain-containing protein [Verrucomicrobiae bacterium]|nr:carboxypeptidase regulatory-like domain-containing protein [Verrucomicrobiae bacterium]